MKLRLQALHRIVVARNARQDVLSARLATFNSQREACAAARSDMLQAVNSHIDAHGHFVDLLARQIARLERELLALEAQQREVAGLLLEETRRLKLAERLTADAVQHYRRKTDDKTLADLIDARFGQDAARLPQGSVGTITIHKMKAAHCPFIPPLTSFLT